MLKKGKPNQHNVKISSDSAVDFQKNTTVEEGETLAKAKAHGRLNK